MNRIVNGESNASAWPDPWQMIVVGLCALILCSCRAPSQGRDAASRQQPGPESLPAEAYAGAAAGVPCAWTADPEMPMPYSPTGPWSPPGIRQPWPEDEYLRDGGDAGKPVGVNARKEVVGLKMEDAVAQYDTRDGRTVVEPSNEVHVYSPRFGAVRQVVGLMADEERQKLGGVHVPLKIDAPTSLDIASSAKQNIQPGDQIGARPPVAMRTRQGEGTLSTSLGPRSFQDAFKTFENVAIIRKGVYEGSEMAFLARGSNAAIAWSHTQAVQVVLDRKGAMADVKYDPATSVYTVTTPPGRPKLRLVKVASTPFAKPGETVDFTIRFDNVGDEPIDNVAILDSLSTRLEYVPDSAQCSVDAKFSTRPNEGESVVVRCDVSKSLNPGQGGVLRFRCRVR